MLKDALPLMKVRCRSFDSLNSLNSENEISSRLSPVVYSESLTFSSRFRPS